MKKIRFKIIISILIITLMLIPFSCGQLKDGGTHEYNALLWGVTKQHSLWSENNQDGYMVGTSVRVFWFEVYNDVEFVPFGFSD